MIIYKLKKLYEEVQKIENEYWSCRNNIIDKEQYNIPITERVKNTETMLNKCQEISNKKMENIINSDEEYNKFRKEHKNSVYIDNKLLNITFAKEISKKYNNILITENDYTNLYFFTSIEDNVKKLYIEKMLEKEFSHRYSIRCLNKNIVDEYTNNYLYRYEGKILEKYPDLKSYPTHEEYMKCYESRYKSMIN